MSSPHFAESRRTVLLAFLVFAIITAVIVLPGFFRTEAVRSGKEKGLFPRTSSQDPDLPNYDIRLDKKAADKIAAFRGRARKDAAAVADARDKFVRAENALKARVPNLKVEYNRTLRAPEVIGPDPKMGKGVLAQASNGRRPDVLKGFLKQNKDLIGASDEQVNGMEVTADYTNPDGGLSFVRLEQEINGIPVFQGEIKAGFSKNGELFRVISNFAPGLEIAAVAKEFGKPSDAVRVAAANIKHDLDEAELASFTQDEKGRKFKYGSSQFAPSAEKIYFPTEPGVAVPAWGVIIVQPVNGFYVVVDAESGTVLWRKNLTNDQTVTPTYYVYANPNSMLDVADNPAPMSPGANSPLLGTQGTITTRVPRQVLGNDGPYSHNGSGWIGNFDNVTIGNNVNSGLDLASPDGMEIGTQATGSPTRVFNSNWNPPPGNPAPGAAPSDAESRRGAVIQQFYVMNRYHDAVYLLGFNEQAGNFQNDNFGRGGAIGGDAILAEGQDWSGTNNANFYTPPDGEAGRMQMYVFTVSPSNDPNPLPNRDSMADSEVMIHEATHGLSNRLHGNALGLNSYMAAGMGEGWSDFYALAMLSEASDPIDGVYAAGAYVTYGPGFVNGTANYYYGIRRFPTAIMAAKGGNNNRPHNPLTFADIDSQKIKLDDGAFAPGFTQPVTAADEVHNAGEIWNAALWEVRALFIQRLGWAEGNKRILQLVTDGMKLSPATPTFLSGRDAIIAAALAYPNGTAADAADIWKGFAIRGMGASASIENAGSGGGTARVTEAFDSPNLMQSPSFTVSDANGDSDGVLEPGETVTLTIPLTNKTGRSADGVKLRVPGKRAVLYGSIPHNGTASKLVDFKIPADTPCGAALKVPIHIHNSLGDTIIERTIYLGTPVTTFTENFDSVTAPAIPASWSVTTNYTPIKFVTTNSTSDSGSNSAFAADLPNCTNPGGPGCPSSAGGTTELVSPLIPITISGARLMFRHKFNTEAGWDGGVLDIDLGDGKSWQDIIAAGGVFEINGYNATLGTSTPPYLGGRNAWSGNSTTPANPGGWITTTLRLPPSAAGKSIRLRWRFGTDNNTAPPGGGWNIDSVNVAGNAAACSLTP